MSKYVKFESPDKPDSVLAFFKYHGFTQTQISTIIRNHPSLLLCDPEKTLLPKLEFFKSKGISITDVTRIVTGSQSVLKRSLEKPHVIPNIEIMREAGVPNSNIMFLLKNQPRVFMTRSDKFRQILKDVETMGFDPLIMTFVSAVHALRSMTKSTWEKKVDVYKKWGWTEEEILVAFKKHPCCMTASEDKINGVMDFLVNKNGLGVFAGCKTVHTDFTELGEEDCAELFLKKFVNYHEEEAPELLKLYDEKLGLAK
ncbi:mitochondrial transcription termination factor family protein [Actinidia rufa]|uniref:Mitochondrial transcription termination factor family protein n=1 Tax=Actinidia rufa TaxID=165716 RepID=A0A7J0GDX0_9ERIC|nr:mitochondrial transcription termination factor family protein [Actinidia rufa]